MKLLSPQFIKGIIGTDDLLYDGRFQVAFMGRSNVGKSTLINSLTMENRLARSSKSPGKTVRMDFFLINDTLYFVDFPGVGYAKRSAREREKLAKMILWYLMYSGVKKRLVILIIDTKVGFTPSDKELLEILLTHNIRHLIVANKVDNLKSGQKEKQLSLIRNEYKDEEVIAYSSKQRQGREELMNKILKIQSLFPS